MENNSDSTEDNYQPCIIPEKIKIFFLQQLNRIYAAKVHLHKSLDKLKVVSSFKYLRFALQLASADVDTQISRLELIYLLIDATPPPPQDNDLTHLMDENFRSIMTQSNDPDIRDLSILAHLLNLESIEIAVYQALRMTAIKIKAKHLTDLLTDSLNESKADKELFVLIISKYL